ncbi:MAG: hypothetical protein WCC60_12900 [Ilumatobacteraceae bacterium]
MRGCAALAVVICMAAFAACSDSESDGTVQSAAPAAAPPEITRQQIVDALNGNMFNTTDTDRLVADCMADSGFQWVVAAADPAAAIADATYVQSYGYGIFSTPVEAAGDDPNLAIFDAMSPAEQGAYNLALVGNEQGVAPISPTSCFGKQQAALQQLSDIASSELMQKILNEYQSLLLSAPEMTAAQAEWQSCMKAAGLDYDNRDTIIAELTALADTLPTGDALVAAKANELRIAQQDYTCSASVREAAVNAAERIKADLVARYAP